MAEMNIQLINSETGREAGYATAPYVDQIHAIAQTVADDRGCVIDYEIDGEEYEAVPLARTCP